MERIINALLKPLRAEIEVTVTAEIISLKCKDKVESFETVIYITPDNKKPHVLAVGGSAPKEPHVRINLFSLNEFPSSYSAWKKNCLVAFLEYAFRRVLNQSGLPMLKPSVTFTGANSLESILCGYQDALLRDAAIEAGAMECRFIP